MRKVYGVPSETMELLVSLYRNFGLPARIRVDRLNREFILIG